VLFVSVSSKLVANYVNGFFYIFGMTVRKVVFWFIERIETSDWNSLADSVPFSIAEDSAFSPTE